jgi:hypothetical protein
LEINMPEISNFRAPVSTYTSLDTLKSGGDASTSEILESGPAGLGGAGKSAGAKSAKSAKAEGKVDAAQDWLLVAQFLQKFAPVLGEGFDKPELAKPEIQLTKVQAKDVKLAFKAIEAMLPPVQKNDIASPAAVEADAKRVNEAFSDKFDITKMKSLPAAELLLLMSFLLRQLGIANTGFEAKLGLIAEKAAHKSADSTIQKGVSEMSTRIAGSALVIAGGVGGAAMTISGHNDHKRNAKTNGTEIASTQRQIKAQENVLSSLDMKKSNKAGEAKHIEMKKADGSKENVELEGSNDTVSNNHKRIVAEEALQKAHDKLDSLHAASDAYKRTGDQKIGAGGVFGAGANAVNAAILGGGQYMASNEEALQKIIDILQRSSTQTSEANREQARAAVNMINELLHAMLDAMKARAQTVSIIAGNTRA